MDGDKKFHKLQGFARKEAFDIPNTQNFNSTMENF
jgi:hypothetical protein